MLQRITQQTFIEAFKQANRQHQFSRYALGALFDYFENVDTEMELDVIAICCYYAEETVESLCDMYSFDGDRAGLIDFLNEQRAFIADLGNTIVYRKFF